MSASWILTQSGKQFDLLAPEADMVVMDDIAHALANICRFAGYTQPHYSVGQHSVLASHLVPPADALHPLGIQKTLQAASAVQWQFCAVAPGG